MKFLPAKNDARNGAIIYATGDTIAAIILGQFSFLRLAGIMLIGATIYAREIPAYFKWIDRKTKNIKNSVSYAVSRTLLALLYFNPLWIARHLIFIALLNRQWQEITPEIFKIAFLSWLINIPISIIANAIIQIVIPLKWRFLWSAVFSGLMAVYYAITGVWLNAEK